MSAVIRPYRGIAPRIHSSAFIAEGAVIIGDVEIGPNVSIWPGCVLRGDVNRIVVGEGTNLQDGTIVHCNSDEQGDYRVTGGGLPCLIGKRVTAGHMVLLHACVVEDDAFIGMRATVMDGAMVESGGMVAAGALVTPGKRVPAGELWAGQPARPMRRLSEKEQAYMKWLPGHYAELAANHMAERE